VGVRGEDDTGVRLTFAMVPAIVVVIASAVAVGVASGVLRAALILVGIALVGAVVGCAWRIGVWAEHSYGSSLCSC
jgi:hypothetical protein